MLEQKQILAAGRMKIKDNSEKKGRERQPVVQCHYRRRRRVTHSVVQRVDEGRRHRSHTESRSKHKARDRIEMRQNRDEIEQRRHTGERNGGDEIEAQTRQMKETRSKRRRGGRRSPPRGAMAAAEGKKALRYEGMKVENPGSNVLPLVVVTDFSTIGALKCVFVTIGSGREKRNPKPKLASSGLVFFSPEPGYGCRIGSGQSGSRANPYP